MDACGAVGEAEIFISWLELPNRLRQAFAKTGKLKDARKIYAQPGEVWRGRVMERTGHDSKIE